MGVVSDLCHKTSQQKAQSKVTQNPSDEISKNKEYGRAKKLGHG
jgi:hypothetical protein